MALSLRILLREKENADTGINRIIMDLTPPMTIMNENTHQANES